MPSIADILGGGWSRRRPAKPALPPPRDESTLQGWDYADDFDETMKRLEANPDSVIHDIDRDLKTRGVDYVGDLQRKRAASANRPMGEKLLDAGKETWKYATGRSEVQENAGAYLAEPLKALARQRANRGDVGGAQLAGFLEGAAEAVPRVVNPTTVAGMATGMAPAAALAQVPRSALIANELLQLSDAVVSAKEASDAFGAGHTGQGLAGLAMGTVAAVGSALGVNALRAHGPTPKAPGGPKPTIAATLGGPSGPRPPMEGPRAMPNAGPRPAPVRPPSISTDGGKTFTQAGRPRTVTVEGKQYPVSDPGVPPGGTGQVDENVLDAELIGPKLLSAPGGRPGDRGPIITPPPAGTESITDLLRRLRGEGHDVTFSQVRDMVTNGTVPPPAGRPSDALNRQRTQQPSRVAQALTPGAMPDRAAMAASANVGGPLAPGLKDAMAPPVPPPAPPVQQRVRLTRPIDIYGERIQDVTVNGDQVLLHRPDGTTMPLPRSTAEQLGIQLPPPPPPPHPMAGQLRSSLDALEAQRSDRMAAAAAAAPPPRPEAPAQRPEAPAPAMEAPVQPEMGPAGPGQPKPPLSPEAEDTLRRLLEDFDDGTPPPLDEFEYLPEPRSRPDLQDFEHLPDPNARPGRPGEPPPPPLEDFEYLPPVPPPDPTMEDLAQANRVPRAEPPPFNLQGGRPTGPDATQRGLPVDAMGELERMFAEPELPGSVRPPGPDDITPPPAAGYVGPGPGPRPGGPGGPPPSSAPAVDFDLNDVKVTEVRGEGYRGRVLAESGPGKPGLSVEDRPHPGKPGETRQSIVVRDEQGNPLATAILERNPDGKLAIGNLAVVEGKGLSTAGGRAVKEVIEQARKMDAARPFSGVSPDARKMIERLTGQKPTKGPKPAAADNVAELENELRTAAGGEGASDDAITHAIRNLQGAGEGMSTQQLVNQAFVDQGTGLPNKPGLDHLVEQQAKARSEQRTPGQVLFAAMDIRNLKAVNDILGQHRGDELISLIADELGRALRKGDIPARFGGDEFMIALQNVSEEGRAVVQQKMNQAVDRALERFGTRQAGDFPLGTRMAFGADKASAMAEMTRQKGLEKGPKYRPMQGGEAGPLPGPPANPVPGVRYEMPASAIDVDAQRFQYRKNVSKKGVDPERKIEGEYDPARGGIIAVWKDPADGKTYVVNGHHRLELAQQHGANVGVVYLKAPNAAQARAEGALINMSEGNSSMSDAVNFLRDSGRTVESLREYGISNRSTIGRDAPAIASLADNVRSKWEAGDLSDGQAAAIGHAKLSPEQQAAVSQLVERQKANGREISPGVLKNVIEQVRRADVVNMAGKGDQSNIFDVLGEDQFASAALQRAELTEFVREQLGRDKRLFGFLTKGDRAGQIEGAGVGSIDKGKAGDIANQAKQIGAVFDRLEQAKGPISDAMNDAARRIMQGENVNEVRKDLLNAVRLGVETELRNPVPKPTGAGDTPGVPGGVKESTPVPKVGTDSGTGERAGGNPPESKAETGVAPPAGVDPELAKNIAAAYRKQAEIRWQLTRPREPGQNLPVPHPRALSEAVDEYRALLDPLKARLSPEQLDQLDEWVATQARDLGDDAGQPRLPGAVGDVRDTENPPALFDAPYGLTGKPAGDKTPTQQDALGELQTALEGGPPAALVDKPGTPVRGRIDLPTPPPTPEPKIAAAGAATPPPGGGPGGLPPDAPTTPGKGGVDIAEVAGTKKTVTPEETPRTGNQQADEIARMKGNLHRAQQAYVARPSERLAQHIAELDKEIARLEGRPVDKLAELSDELDVDDVELPPPTKSDKPIFDTDEEIPRATTYSQLAANKRDFLIKRLKYTEADINEMTVQQANEIGEKQIYNPKLTERNADAKARYDRNLAEAEQIFEQEQPGKVAAVIQRGRDIRQKARKPAEAPTGSKLEQARERQAQMRAEAEREMAAAKETPLDEKRAATPQEMKAKQDKMAHRARDIHRAMENGDYEEAARIITEQAEDWNTQRMKAGTKEAEKVPAKHRSGEYLASDFGAIHQFLFTPEGRAKVAAFTKEMSKNPAVTGLVGGVIGVYSGDTTDEQIQRGLMGMIAGAGTPGGARALGQAFDHYRRTGKIMRRSPTSKSQDLGYWRGFVAPTSVERTVPDVFNKAREVLKELQEYRSTNPNLKPEQHSAAEKIARSEMIEIIRHDMKKAAANGQAKLAKRLEMTANQMEGKPTAGQKLVKDTLEFTGIKKNATGREVEHIAQKHIYRVLLGWGLDSAAKNLFQPTLAMLHVSPRNMMRSMHAARTKEADDLFNSLELKLRRPVETDDEMAELLGVTTGGRASDSGRFMRNTDNWNRKWVFFGSLAEQGELENALKGKASQKAIDEAERIMRLTQGETGPMSSAPMFRGPVGGTLKPFMKFPNLAIENVLDAFQGKAKYPKSAVLSFMALGLIGHQLGLDLTDVLIGGARPLGIDPLNPRRAQAPPAISAMGRVGEYISGDARVFGDFFPASTKFEDVVNSDLAYLTAGRYPTKVAKTLHGLSASDDPTSDLMSLVGLTTGAKSEKRATKQNAYEWALEKRQQAGAESKRNRTRMERALKSGDDDAIAELEELLTPEQIKGVKGKIERGDVENIRRTVPLKYREEFDRVFADELERERSR